MKFLLDPEFKPAFIPAAIVHIILVLTKIELFRWDCKGSCESLTYADMPVSLFYFFMGNGWIIFFSLTLGTLYWGMLGYVFYKFLRWIFAQFGVR